MKFTDKLKKMGACEVAVEFAAKYSSLQETWDACDRGDWMLWLIGKKAGKPDSKSRKKLVLTVCKCARLSLKYMEKNEKRPLITIQTVEKWAKGQGDISLADVRAAAAASADAAAYAAYAAAYAAYAADATTYAAADVTAYAADAAADAVADIAYVVERKKILKKCADIVRKSYPKALRI